MTTVHSMLGIVDFKSLNIDQLRSICKEYKIPVQGAKNKKDLLNIIMIRKQLFKPQLPAEIYKNIILYSTFEDVYTFKCTCKLFYKIIDDHNLIYLIHD